MATRSERSFRGRLTDIQLDEMLIRMMEQLDSLHTWMGNVEAHIFQPTNESSHVEQGEAWINNMSIPVNQCCLVSFSCGVYNNSVWCDVIPMKIAHIIFGHPWLYDLDVHHYGRENTYKKVVLKPMTIAEIGKYQVQT